MINGRRIHHLSYKGMKWEGICINGIPVGYGVLYDENNKIIYRGYMYGLIKKCSGTVYSPDTQGVKHTGEFCNNERCGYGELYNKENEQVYAGEWKHDLPQQPNLPEYYMEYYSFNSSCQEITITDMNIPEYNWSFKINCFEELKRISIANHFLNHVQYFEISKCNKLETVVITNESDNMMETDVSEVRKRNSSKFTITDCLNLMSIRFYDNCCQYFTSCELSRMKRELN